MGNKPTTCAPYCTPGCPEARVFVPPRQSGGDEDRNTMEYPPTNPTPPWIPGSPHRVISFKDLSLRSAFFSETQNYYITPCDRQGGHFAHRVLLLCCKTNDVGDNHVYETLFDALSSAKGQNFYLHRDFYFLLLSKVNFDQHARKFL